MRIEAAFWDTSAVVPLCCHQTASLQARQVARQYDRMVVWWSASVEAYSALSRLLRQTEITQREFQRAVKRLEQMESTWWEIAPEADARSTAKDMLSRYDLRAADALQLAAALVWCEHNSRRRPFICFDQRLAEAARKSGFTVLP